MTLTEAIAALRKDLSDGGSALLSDAELTRAVQRAVSDVSRFIPRELVLEVTLDLEVDDEDWTSDASPGTYVSLANSPIEYDSETVKDGDGNTCTRDTDYIIDYANGEITHISGGEIGNAEGCTISYNKSALAIDISSIVSSLIRVERVEYPVGQVPQSFAPYTVVGDYLFIGAVGESSQSKMTDKSHIAICYKAKHTAPVADTDGTYPEFLDDVVLMASAAYALLIVVQSLLQMAKTAQAAISTEVGVANGILDGLSFDNIATDLAAAGTALTSAATQAAAAASALASVSIADATTALAAANTVLDAILTTSIDKATTGAEAYLDTGDDKITTLNTADRVSEKYREYAQARAELANARVSTALGYVQEATQRINAIALYVNESNGYSRAAEAYIAEAAQHVARAQAELVMQQVKISQAEGYLGDADRYATAAQLAMNLADKYRFEASERRNEAWAIWGNPPEYAPQISMSSVQQTGK